VKVPQRLRAIAVAWIRAEIRVATGLQLEGSYKLGETNTLRAGVIASSDWERSNVRSLVLPVNALGRQLTDQPVAYVQRSAEQRRQASAFLQDEWKPFEQLTINFGGRFDVVNAFSNENQLSPRVNVVYTPFKGTAIHAGYARYFTPPPLEAVEQSTIAKFIGTTNESAIKENSSVTAERAHYFDVGVTQEITKGLNAGIDGYYKSSHSVLDEGQFGQALILSSFNYKRGEIYGGEITSSYDHGPFSAYLNAGYEWARGTQVSSAQFLFDPDELAYISNHWVFLDHDQRFTASAGVSYSWNAWKAAVDGLYGNGLRRGFANTQKNDPYETFNLSLHMENAAFPGNSSTVTVHTVKLDEWSLSVPEDDFVMEQVGFQALWIGVEDAEAA